MRWSVLITNLIHEILLFQPTEEHVRDGRALLLAFVCVLSARACSTDDLASGEWSALSAVPSAAGPRFLCLRHILFAGTPKNHPARHASDGGKDIRSRPMHRKYRFIRAGVIFDPK